MKIHIRDELAVIAVFLVGVAAATAQTSQGSTGNDSAADQFKAGAQHIGDGATQIGEGIKQGAIQTWEAVKAGASAAADKVTGPTAPPKQNRPVTPSSEETR